MSLIKRLLPLAAIFLSATATMQARTAADFFVQAPDNLFKLVDATTRMDMLDYYASRMDRGAANKLGGESKIIAQSPQRMAVQMTPQSVVEIAIVPYNTNDTLVVVVTTYEANGQDSKVQFFTTSWQPAKGTFYTVPAWKDWLLPDQKQYLGEIEAQVPFMLTAITLSPDAQTLTVTNSLSTFLDPDQYETIAPRLKDSLTYHWNGKKYVLS